MNPWSPSVDHRSIHFSHEIGFESSIEILLLFHQLYFCNTWYVTYQMLFAMKNRLKKPQDFISF